MVVVNDFVSIKECILIQDSFGFKVILGEERNMEENCQLEPT
jgi:hypothetical protein